MIITMIPYCPRNKGTGKFKGRDLGYVYNEMMSRLREGDWGVFLDHDAQFTTPWWYRQIEEAIEQHPEVSCFAVMTNRIGCPWQRADVDTQNHDMRYHRAIGKALYNEHGSYAIDVTTLAPVSGVCLILSYNAWRAGARFREGAFFGVDNSLHNNIKRLGESLFLIRGLYVYHWYRGDGDMSHLPMAGKKRKPHMDPKLVP